MAECEQQPFFEHDIPYMEQAYAFALKAYDLGEIPVGALVVSSTGNLLGSGYNLTQAEGCQIAHAEVRAITSACQALDDWRLEGCTLYVTLQPCMMCWGLASLSRIERVVYGAESPLYGFRIDNLSGHPVYTKHTKFVSGGVLKDENETLLKKFFKTVRDL